MRSIKYLSFFFLFLFLGNTWAPKTYVNAISVQFGTYNSYSHYPLLGTGRIIVVTDSSTPYIVRIDSGKNSSQGFHPRLMRSKKDRLSYNLYIDAACTGVWGDGTDNTYTRTGSGSLEFIIYGSIPAFQNVAPGFYSDVVTVSIEW
ncbi:MAG: spore coat protein U domain-containing protein [Candidatus Aminicenantes bacterium]|nr:MAG: spore coat protein U domain-containing protein [Candidatus Aminicenantes bacterium]